MAIKFEKIEVGMRLLDIHSELLGNTTMRELGLWHVDVVSVDAKRRGAMVRWNGNPDEWWPEKKLCRLYLKPTKKYLAQEEAQEKRRR